MKTVIIYRPRWCRGGEGGISQLLNEQGNRCCLGFAANACGATDKQIREICTPRGLYANHGLEMPGLLSKFCNVRQTNKVCDNLMSTNDETPFLSALPVTDREERLIKLAAEAGYRFVFTDCWVRYKLSRLAALLPRLRIALKRR